MRKFSLQDNPLASLLLIAAIIGLIAFASWDRRTKIRAELRPLQVFDSNGNPITAPSNQH